jgi:hypothetical protein
MAFENINWKVPTTATGAILDWDAVQLAILMDIRRELRRLNRILGCNNFLRLPHDVNQIRCNTAKPRAKKVKA